MKALLRVFLGLMIVTSLSCEKTVTITKEEPHWEYEHPDWKSMGYNDCGGNSQSPINIVTANAIPTAALSGITFNYAPFALKLVDNSHTLQVNATDASTTITYNAKPYKFLQLHYHHKSEHKINDVQAEMELHLVHQDAQGNLLVLAYMIMPGAENALLKQVLANVPEKQKTEVTIPGMMVDLAGFQPVNKGYYTYFGSLTTPPCSASVQFLVLKEQITATPAQIAAFAAHYENNARPVQPLNNRIILEKI